MKAYDIEPRPGLPRDHPECAGWCFGLPPGIAPTQWPLDPASGYPLQHGFTLRLPEDYRVHGPDIVALSFFATAFDHNDGGPTATAGIGDNGDFRDHESHAHPRLHRMVDLIGCHYAAILLTRAEYEGAFCQPPAIAEHPLLKETPRPAWLDKGSARAFGVDLDARMPPGMRIMATETYEKTRADAPAALDLHLPFVLTERADPNAGVKPEEWPEEGDAYESPFTEDFEVKPWAKDFGADHLGGTMMPQQGYPDFGPYYIEFEESFGGYNFGTGNAQLDIETLGFDWACG